MSPAASSSAPAAKHSGGWIGLALGSVTPILAQLAFASVAINLLSLSLPIFVVQIYDRVIPHAGVETLKGLFIGVLALIVFDFLLRQARSRLVRMVALRVDASISAALFARASGLPLRELEARSEAEWRHCLRDSDVLRDAVAGPTVLLMVDLPFFLMFILAIGYLAPPLAWTLLALTPVYLGLALLSSRMIRRASRAEQKAGLDKDRLTGEVVSGRATVKGLGLGPALTERWEGAQAALIRSAARRGGYVDDFNNLGASLALLTSALLSTVGALAIIDQQMTIGGLIAANMLAGRALQPVTQLISLWRGIERYQDAAARVNALLARRPERERGEVARPRPLGEIRLEKVSFAYEPEGPPALDKVSLRFAPGRMTGIFGANGGGKSTLLKAILGLYAPTSGRVLLDGADLAQFGREEIARWIGYTPQEPFLFAGTIRDNIARGRPDVSDAAVLRAAERAAAAPFIDALPDGFAAEVGEGGRRLSSGQRQRLALARALVEDPPILLLDEPSANLDAEAEAALIARLTELKAGRAVIVVSHSRAMLEACDTLVVLNEGRVAISGRGEEILARSRPATPARASEARSILARPAAPERVATGEARR